MRWLTVQKQNAALQATGTALPNWDSVLTECEYWQAIRLLLTSRVATRAPVTRIRISNTEPVQTSITFKFSKTESRNHYSGVVRSVIDKKIRLIGLRGSVVIVTLQVIWFVWWQWTFGRIVCQRADKCTGIFVWNFDWMCCKCSAIAKPY